MTNPVWSLTICDWISPAVAFVQDALNGPHHTFAIPLDEWPGPSAFGELKRAGIRSWGHMIVSDYVLLTVRRDAARRAAYVLNRAGAPVEIPERPKQQTRGLGRLLR